MFHAAEDRAVAALHPRRRRGHRRGHGSAHLLTRALQSMSEIYLTTQIGSRTPATVNRMVGRISIEESRPVRIKSIAWLRTRPLEV